MVLQPQQTHWGLNEKGEQWAGLSVLKCCRRGADRKGIYQQIQPCQARLSTVTCSAARVLRKPLSRVNFKPKLMDQFIY